MSDLPFKYRYKLVIHMVYYKCNSADIGENYIFIDISKDITIRNLKIYMTIQIVIFHLQTKFQANWLICLEYLTFFLAIWLKIQQIKTLKYLYSHISNQCNYLTYFMQNGLAKNVAIMDFKIRI